MGTAVKSKPAAGNTTGKKKKRGVRCSICGKRSIDNRGLAMHMRWKHGKRRDGTRIPVREINHHRLALQRSGAVPKPRRNRQPESTAELPNMLETLAQTLRGDTPPEEVAGHEIEFCPICGFHLKSLTEAVEAMNARQHA